LNFSNIVINSVLHPHAFTKIQNSNEQLFSLTVLAAAKEYDPGDERSALL